jgi:hypothetical protein
VNGPQHFQQALDHLVTAKEEALGTDEERYHLGVATVHAILAVAAAVATNDRLEGMTVDQLAEWLTVLSDGKAVSRG